MRITDLDRRRAIRRFPEFQKDLASYRRIKEQHKRTLKEIELENKWLFSIEAIERSGDVAQNRKDAQTVEDVIRITDAPYMIIYQGEEKTPIRLTGDCLYLKIHLKGKTEAQLVDDFKQAIKPYKVLLDAEILAETKKERNRKTDIHEGIWAVYDLYLNTGKNMNETTRRWFSLSGTPSSYYANKPGYFDDKYLKRVQKAVKNAGEIILSVRKDYGLK